MEVKSVEPKLLLTILLLITATFYSIAFIVFNVTKAHLSKENVNRGSLKFWTIFCFLFGMLCFISTIVLTIIPWTL